MLSFAVAFPVLDIAHEPMAKAALAALAIANA
jgi:hypothetical protein